MAVNLMNIKQLSEFLEIPKATLYFYSQQGMIPFLKVGRHLRYDAQEVLAYLRRKETKSTMSCQAPPDEDTESNERSLKTRKLDHGSLEREDDHGNL